MKLSGKDNVNIPTLKFARTTLFSTLLLGLYANGTLVLAAEPGAPAKGLSPGQMTDLASRFSLPKKNAMAVQDKPSSQPAAVAVEKKVEREPAQSAKVHVPEPAVEVTQAPRAARAESAPAKAGVDSPVSLSTITVLPGPSLQTMIRNGQRPAGSELRSLLRDLVGKALQHSPEVRVANANQSAAGYDIDEVKGRRWPQVRLGMNTALTRDDSRSGRSGSGDTSGTLSVTTNVWDWGKNASELRTAKAALGSAELTGQVEREQVAFDTSSGLVNLMRYQQSMAVAEDYVQQMSSRVDMLSKITQSDKGRASELVQARAKLLSALASRTQIENQRELTRIKLQRLLGEEAPVMPEGLELEDSLVVDPTTALAALDKHPLLLRLKAQAEMEDGRAAALKADGLPGLNLVARKEENGLSGGNDDLDRDNGWYVGFDVQWQAFSGGSNKAAQAAAGARKSAALEQYEKASEDLRQEINRLAQSRITTAQLAQEYQRLSTETDRVRKMFYEQWYNLGKRTLLDVLVAENDHFNSQLQAINNRWDSVIADLSILSSSALLLGYLSL
ncbi:TolC family protein [Pseudomonas sp. SK3(2021)]|uniref:TolC family protein n=1 Tax=Pseudomonas sp. SK3(2021) TaxID=2841064 RepID=UPI00192BA63E|nr:TolC family protein [Pseudomonas sp. SK3(2021)]QQZ39518.1 TolC family protein [Pseudomonas sp. SK3(2021)]